MGIATSSPAMTLLYAWALMFIFLGVPMKEMSRKEKYLVAFFALFLAAGNGILSRQIGGIAYGKSIALTMHLPTFLIFWKISDKSIMKVIFITLSVLVFTVPVVLANKLASAFAGGNAWLVTVMELNSMAIVLGLSWFVFRRGFRYLLKYAKDREIFLYSLVPILYYVYVFVGQNSNIGELVGVNGLVIRLLPTIYVFLFYMLLMYNYYELKEKHNLQAERLALEYGLISAEEQMKRVNEYRLQDAIYRHDMRHHLQMIAGFLEDGKTEQAAAYILEVQEGIDAIKIIQYCENELINLLCASFAGRAEKLGISWKVKAAVSQNLAISDSELCVLISNALENALNAASCQEEPKWIEFFCEEKMGKLLLEVKNPYDGIVEMEEGLPKASEEGHGYGARSIRGIVERYHGQYHFESKNGMFILRVVIPLN